MSEERIEEFLIDADGGEGTQVAKVGDASITVNVRVRDMDRTKLFVHEIETLLSEMRVMASPHAERLERAFDRYISGGDDEHAEGENVTTHRSEWQWPAAVSDGLTLPCADCGEIPRFDYHVDDDFWDRWVPDRPAHLGVVCLPCLDKRCGGVGLVTALEEVQWTGTGHTVVMAPSFRLAHG